MTADNILKLHLGQSFLDNQEVDSSGNLSQSLLDAIAHACLTYILNSTDIEQDPQLISQNSPKKVAHYSQVINIICQKYPH